MAAFTRAYMRLSPAQRAQFKMALQEFVTALLEIEAGRTSTFPHKLRIKKVKGVDGIWEMTWAPNGRATFSWGQEQQPGKRHVVWLDIGTHNILP